MFILLNSTWLKEATDCLNILLHLSRRWQRGRSCQGGQTNVCSNFKSRRKLKRNHFLQANLPSHWPRNGGWGKLSAPEVQEIAQAAYEDGLRHADIEKLASIGGWGKFAGNMQRDLMMQFDKKVILSTSTLEVGFRLLTSASTWADTSGTFLSPHKLFSNLFHHLPSAFKEFILGGDQANIKTFWTSFKDHPLLTARPSLKSRPDLLTRVVPLSIHGDGVQYMQVQRAGGKGLDVLSWTSMLSRGPTKFRNWLLFPLVKSVVRSFGIGRTWAKAWRVLAWSFDALAKSTWPDNNWKGEPFQDPSSLDFQKKGQLLANGFSAVILLLKADLKFLAAHLGLNHTGSNEPCCLCKANRDMQSRPWTDCRLAAAWRRSCWFKEEWATEHGDHCHPFFNFGDHGIDMVYPDLMHCKHLGTDQILLGSVLSWFAKNFLRGIVQENLEYVMAWIKEWQKDQRGQEKNFPSDSFGFHAPIESKKLDMAKSQKSFPIVGVV